MPSRRIERLNEQLRRELAELIQHRVRDPRVGNVTVTGVRTDSDLTFARVAVRVLGDDEARQEAMEGLEAAAPFLRGTLGRELHIRRVPELAFELDHTLERAARIEEILHDVRPEGGWEEQDEDPEEEADG